MVDSAYQGDYDAVQAELAAGVSPDAKSPIGMTALMAAARNNNLKIVKLLLDAGANVNAQDSHGWTALMAAAYKGNTEAVRMLIEAGAIIDMRSNEGKTAVDMSVDRKDRETLTYFYDVIGTRPNTTPADIEVRIVPKERPAPPAAPAPPGASEAPPFAPPKQTPAAPG